MYLEQVAYNSYSVRRREEIFVIGDLERLSSFVMYAGSGPLPPPRGSGPLTMMGGPRGVKIMGPSGPLVRLDFPRHGSSPPMHLQYGKSHAQGGFDPQRSGNEAAEIIAEIFRKNTKIKLPGQD